MFLERLTESLEKAWTVIRSASLEKEWSVISSAPFGFVLLLVIATAVVIWKIAAAWHKREKDALRATLTNKDNLAALQRSEMQHLKADVAALKTQLEVTRKDDKIPPADLVPILYGDPALKQSFLELTSGEGLNLKADPTKPDLIVAVLTSLSRTDQRKIAAARHLAGMGLVGGVKKSAPGTVTVVGSAAAADLRRVLDLTGQIKITAGSAALRVVGSETKKGESGRE